MDCCGPSKLTSVVFVLCTPILLPLRPSTSAPLNLGCPRSDTPVACSVPPGWMYLGGGR